MITISLPPPYYKDGSKAIMSMNIFRNMHPYLLNKFKIAYGELCSQALSSHDKCMFNSLKVSYVLNTVPTKAGKPKKVDMTNVLSIIDKVFMDVLVKDGWLEDDTIEFVAYTRFTANPYAEEMSITVTMEEANGK